MLPFILVTYMSLAILVTGVVLAGEIGENEEEDDATLVKVRSNVTDKLSCWLVY